MHPQPIIADEYETWENRAAGMIYLWKFNEQGTLAHQGVPGGSKIQVTPHERRINQEKAAGADLDVFQNGMLAPLRLIDAEEDTKDLQANSNAMSETAMKALFRSQIPTFTKKVNEISNPITLTRLLEVASEVDATIRQEKIIRERMSEVTPTVDGSRRVGSQNFNAAGDAPMRGVTPR